MRKYIKSDELKVDDFPVIENMDWDKISIFALSFDPELELGTNEIYKLSNMNYDKDSTVQNLRMCLFLKQRWWNNRLSNIDQPGLEEMREIIRLIRSKI